MQRHPVEQAGQGQGQRHFRIACPISGCHWGRQIVLFCR